MKFEKNIEAFIQLRIEGHSFDEIAKELKTSKSTLIEWNKKAEVKGEIYQGKAFAINNMVKAFEFDKQTRLKAFLQLSKKINDELLKRDLTEISTDTLLKMGIANDNRIIGVGMVDKNIQFGKNPNEFIVEGFDKKPDGFFNLQLDE